MLTRIFGGSIDYGRVRIAKGAGANLVAIGAFQRRAPAITLGRTIYYRDDFYREDFTANPADAALLAHETTHIWQYQTRLGETLGPPTVALDTLKHGKDAYEVANLTADTDFNSLGYEQQAEAVLEYATAMLGGHAANLARYGAVLRSGGIPLPG
ncbi:eCIS core domain-containing protein [Caulobacter ginsengisoli]|nr:DUF4157 domain-containing protein [Caulobacter ginsengisoli]